MISLDSQESVASPPALGSALQALDSDLRIPTISVFTISIMDIEDTKLDLASNHSFEPAHRAESEFGNCSFWRAWDRELTESGIEGVPLAALALPRFWVSELVARARIGFAP